MLQPLDFMYSQLQKSLLIILEGNSSNFLISHHFFRDQSFINAWIYFLQWDSGVFYGFLKFSLSRFVAKLYTKKI